MPRPTNFVSLIRNIVREQVQQAIQGLLGASGSPKRKAANGRRRRRRKHRGPGRPPRIAHRSLLRRPRLRHGERSRTMKRVAAVGVLVLLGVASLSVLGTSLAAEQKKAAVGTWALYVPSEIAWKARSEERRVGKECRL